MKTNLEPLVAIFPCKLPISVVLQLVMNTCGLEDISKHKHIHDYEFIKKQA